MKHEPTFIVVIRSSNERTEKLCQQIVQEQADQHEVITIHEKPFKKALEEGYRLGIKKQTKWLITVDADMLLLPGALGQLIQQAEKMPDHYAQLQGRIFDKITGDVRKAGPRIYRVSLLKKALEISEKSEDTIRPESFVISSLGNEGHPSRFITYVTCIHDFEQYYTDIYRKSIVHASKHEKIISKIILRAVEKMEDDKDFKVILKAVWDGLMNNQKVSIDSRLFKDQATEALNALNFKEKDKLKVNYNFQNLLSEKVPNAIVNQPNEMTFHDQPIPHYSPIKKVINIYEKKGIIDGFLFSLGTALITIGNRIKR